MTAIAAAAAIGLGLYSLTLSNDLDDTRSALAQAERAQDVLADATAQDVTLASGQGRLVVDPDGDAVLVLDRVGPAPSGKTYQTWIIDGGSPKPAGLFPGADGQDVVLVDGAVKPGAVVAVTVEPEGGVDAPTTQPIVASDPV